MIIARTQTGSAGTARDESRQTSPDLGPGDTGLCWRGLALVTPDTRLPVVTVSVVIPSYICHQLSGLGKQ